jgi:hypothetical protein
MVSAFVKGKLAPGIQRVVDRLMASPAYGDRWGRHWLDVTYWADTTGVGRPHSSAEAWRYRGYHQAFSQRQTLQPVRP